MLPIIILVLSLALAAYFYSRLPAEVAYRFKADGSPEGWLGRGALVLWMLGPQFIFTLASVGLTWGIIRLSTLFRQPERSVIKPERVLLFMGNMMVLPQSVLGFAMLDIFSYNSYKIHILPLWVFALLVSVVGGIVLGVFFLQALRQAARTIR